MPWRAHTLLTRVSLPVSIVGRLWEHSFWIWFDLSHIVLGTHTHTDTLVTWLRRCFCARQAYIVCRARGGLWCNQYQISAVSLWALIPSGSLDWLLAAYAIPLLSPTSPVFPLPFFLVPTLSLPITLCSLSVCTPHTPLPPFSHSRSFTLAPVSAPLVFFFPPLPSSPPRRNHPRDCSSSHDVFPALPSCLTRWCQIIAVWLQLPYHDDHYCIFAWQCTASCEHIEMLYPI